MSASYRKAGTTIKAVLLCTVFGAGAGLAEDELPGLDLLEYLGSWEESDEDWVLVQELDAKALAAERKRRNDSETLEEESTESEHEG